MFAPLVAPFLTELGVGIAEVGASLGIREGIANKLGGAAVGFVASEVGGAVENLGVRVIGKERVDKAEAAVKGFSGDAYAAFTQNTKYFLDKNKSSSMTRYHEAGSLPSSAPSAPSAPTNVPSVRNPPPSAKDISKFIVDYSSKVATDGMYSGKIDPIKTSMEINPNIAAMLGQFLADKIPDDALYKQIASVYNGLGMTVDKNSFVEYDSNNKYKGLTLIDETGKKVSLPINKGFVIPALYGIFVGAYSPNNAKPVSLLDLLNARGEKYPAEK